MACLGGSRLEAVIETEGGDFEKKLINYVYFSESYSKIDLDYFLMLK